jgi:hypothetical protein
LRLFKKYDNFYSQELGKLQGGNKMDRLTNELYRLREEEPDVAHVLDVFGEIERVYRDTLEAMGVTRKHVPEVRNSAEVTLSFNLTPSSSGE